MVRRFPGNLCNTGGMMNANTAGHRTALLKPVGLAAVALLALTACDNPFDVSGGDSAPSTEEPAEGTEAEAGAEEVPEEAPTFGEIQEEMWEAMLAADSVTIEGEVQAAEADLDELFEGIDEDAVGDIRISGSLDGSDAEMSYSAGEGNAFTQRTVEGTEYFRGEDFGTLLLAELDDEVAEAVDEDFLNRVMEDQWVEFSAEGEAGAYSAEDIFAEWQSELAEEDLDGLTGEVAEREGQQVFVYTAEDDDSREYVVSAEGEPYLLAWEDEESSYSFSQWDAAEQPETPENIITLDEIFEAVAEEQGWPTDDLEDLDNLDEDASGEQ